MSVNENVCGSPAGVVTTSTRIVPRLTKVKVHVTVSPAASPIASGALPSEQVEDARSHATPGNGVETE